jgi:hypothetical protein
MDGTVDSNGVMVITIGRPFNQSFSVIYLHSWRELTIMTLLTAGTLVNHSCLSDVIFPFLTPCQFPGSDSCDVTDYLSVGTRLESQIRDMVNVIFLSPYNKGECRIRIPILRWEHVSKFPSRKEEECRRQLNRRNFGNTVVDKKCLVAG